MWSSIVFVIFYNITFFKQTIEVYPVAQYIGFLCSLMVVLFAFVALLFTLFSSKWTTKPLLILSFIFASLAAYFMDTYHVVIDDDMIRNILQTDMKESFDLFSFRQVVYVVFLGFLPAYIVYKIPIYYVNLPQALWQKCIQVFVLLLIMGITVFIFSKHYTSFVREYKPLRFSTNPSYWMYAVGNYAYGIFHTENLTLSALGQDASIIKKEHSKPKIVIMIVGEAARADHFSLNGYDKETNPLLKKEDILNFSHVSSCGTSTAASVPCMFSIYTKENYSYKKAKQTENVLDILAHTHKIALLWRDNNSDSKGVALRIPYESYKTTIHNTLCDEGECRDIGMLVGLKEYIHTHNDKDILIVLHQMGNHGPAYYKRYPRKFEYFKPVCKTNQLEVCSKKEINNAYDNAILYTDYFLTQTIALLKTYKETHYTAMLYMSDHGESLGEHGVYLHGLPYFMAPSAQTHVAAMLWMNQSFKATFKDIDTTKQYSQDNLFHSLLGIFDVDTKIYNPDLNIFKTNK